MALPILGAVWPRREVGGLVSLAQSTDESGKALILATPEPPEVLLQREYGGDAHFAIYTVAGEASIPRIRKRALPELLSAGATVTSQWLVYELDNQPHAPHPSPELAQERFANLWDLRISLQTPSTFVCRPHFAYVTRGGFRIGFALSAPVAVGSLEELLAGFRRLLDEAVEPLGVGKTDPACSDWTRFFRVPKATREGAPLWTEPWFALRIDDGARPLVPVASIPRAQPTAPRAAAALTPEQLAAASLAREALAPQQPSDEEAAELLDLLFPGFPTTPTHLGAEVARRLRGRHSAAHVLPPPLGPYDPLAPPQGPGRHQALVKLAGDLAAWLAPLRPVVTPQHAYALAYPQVSTFEETPGDEVPSRHGTWLNHLWQLIAEFWAKEVQAHPPSCPESLLPPSASAKAQQNESRIERQSTLLGRMIEGVRAWADPAMRPAYPRGDFDAETLWVSKRLILVGGKGEYYVLRPDGLYDFEPTSSDALVPRLRQLGLDELVALESPDGKLVSAASIVHRHGYHMAQRVLVADLQSASGTPGGALIDHPLRPTMRYSSFCRRRDIEPQYDPRVEAWLRAFAPDPADYDFLCRWIAYALAWDEGPICALALEGASGAGKKLLARGLAECIYPVGEYATGRDFGRFGEGLARSPFLVIDEGFPSSIPLHDRADVFRQLVGGERTEIEMKNVSRFKSQVPMRILITANAVDPIQDLAGGRDLSEHDREALMVRIRHLHVPRGAKEHLDAQGGIEHTRGWIEGDAGQRGDSVIARHFLALYRDRHRWPKDKRLLVEGTHDEKLRKALGQASGMAALVAEALCGMLEKGQGDIELDPEKGAAYVTSQAVVEHLRVLSRRTGGSPPTAKRVGEAMRHWSPGKQQTRQDSLRTWRYPLDLEALLAEAEERGLPGRKRILDLMMRDPKAAIMKAATIIPLRPKDSLKGGS